MVSIHAIELQYVYVIMIIRLHIVKWFQQLLLNIIHVI